MKMEVKNFSGISKAVIEYNGFTIITGKNSTGKSTLGKILYFIFNEFKNTNSKYMHYINYSLNRRLEEFMSMDNTVFGKTMSDIADFSDYLKYDAIPKLVNARETNDEELEKRIIETIKNRCNDVTIEINDSDIALNPLSGKIVYFTDVELYKRFVDTIYMSKSEALHNILRSNIRDYFDTPYNKATDDDLFIELKIKNESTIISSSFGTQFFDINSYIDIKNNVFYIDDDVLSNIDDIVYTLDSDKNRWIPASNTFLRNIYEIKTKKEADNFIERAMYRTETDEIRKKINDTYSPFLLFDNEDEEISPASKDVALGFKLFILLDKLLEHGIIMEKDVVILDEPEIHIHPSLQVDLAQMLFELREALDLTMIVNTHSPFFVEALSRITDLNTINPKQSTNLYSMNGNPGNFVSKDVSDNPSKIFDEMSEAYKKIDNLKLRNYKNEE